MTTARRTVAALITAIIFALITPAGAHAAVPGSPNDRLVQAWYRDFLDREAYRAQVDGTRFAWVDQLDAGRSRQDVLRDITRSREYAELTVWNLYRDLLGRNPDPGAEYWTRGITQGMAPEWVEQNILASTEFISLESVAVEGELLAWYAIILDRQGFPSEGEFDYWYRQSLAGRSNLDIVRSIWYSPEGVNARLAVAYDDLFNRRTDGGTGYWYGPMVNSRLETEIALASTGEYAFLVGAA